MSAAPVAIRLLVLLCWGVLGLSVSPPAAQACDFCNFYFGILPNDRQHRLEVFYRYSRYNGYTNFRDGGASQPHRWFKAGHVPSGPLTFDESDYELYHTTEFRGTFFVHSRIALQAILPIVSATESSQAGAKSVTSLGDLSLTATWYPWWYDGQRWSARLGLMGGVKAPTGAFPNLGAEPAPNVHLYGGSGSWDGLLGLNLQGRYRSWGALAYGNLRLTTANPQGYRYTNSLNLGATAFYSWRPDPEGPWTLTPQAGLYYENTNGEYEQGEWVPHTGGQLLFVTLGAQLNRKRWTLTAQAFAPVYRDVLWEQLGNAGRLVVGLGYAFGSAPNWGRQVSSEL